MRKISKREKRRSHSEEWKRKLLYRTDDSNQVLVGLRNGNKIYNAIIV